METFRIGDQPVGPGEPTFVIAEAGSNHNGDLATAKELIDVAVDAGADAVKFQTFRAEDLYVEESGEADNTNTGESIYEMIESMEMPYEWIPELSEYCEQKDILFMSTPFDEKSADELSEYVPAWKVASSTSSHHPFLRYLAKTEKPIIMSTGIHNMDEVRESVGVLEQNGANKYAVLQCVAAYPTPLDEINVSVIKTLVEEFNVPSGLSDHTLEPVTAPTTAVALGASIVEKHFTLDKTMDGPDHQFALNPQELGEMISAIRDTEMALGTGEKQVANAEMNSHEIARRAIHASTDINAGEKFTQDNINIIRPGKRETGLHPKHYNEILGKIASEDIVEGQGIHWKKIN